MSVLSQRAEHGWTEQRVFGAAACAQSSGRTFCGVHATWPWGERGFWETPGTGRWSVVVVLSRNAALRLKIPRFPRPRLELTRRRWARASAPAGSRESGTGAHHRRKVAPSLADCSTTTFAMQTSRVHIGRQLLRARARVGCESVRTFSISAPRGVKEPPPPPPKDTQDGTTHFGFETIAEALKEQRGEH